MVISYGQRREADLTRRVEGDLYKNQRFEYSMRNKAL
jgi:hypothetical protein